MEEDRAEKLGREVGGDVIEGRGLLDTSLDGGQQGAPPPWDAEAGARGVGLGLDEETLPSCDSLLSLDEDASFLDHQGTPEQAAGAAVDPDWGAGSVGTAEKVFSLDLDHLEAPSTPGAQEYVLPNLITFSPIDDRRC